MTATPPPDDTSTATPTATDALPDAPTPPRRWVGWLKDLAIMGVILLGVSLWQGRDLLGSGQPAPPFALTTTQGQHVTSDVMRAPESAGKRTILVFWAPWCPVCGAESDNLSRVQSLLGSRVRVLTIVSGYKKRAEVDAFIQKHHVDYPVLLGQPQHAAAYNVSAFPTLYVIDAQGRVRHTAVGYTTTLGMIWRALL